MRHPAIVLLATLAFAACALPPAQQSLEEHNRELNEHGGAYAAAFSPDDRTLALCGHNVIEFYDVPSGARRRAIYLRGGGVGPVAFTAEGSAVVVAGATVYRLDPPLYRPAPVRTLKDLPTDPELLEGGRMLVSNDLWDLTVTDLRTGRSRRIPGEWPVSRAWEPRRAILVGKDNQVALVDAATLRTLASATLPYPAPDPRALALPDHVQSLAGSPEGDAAYIGTEKGSLYRWRPGSAPEPLVEVGTDLFALAASGGGRRLVAGAGQAMVIDAASGRVERRVPVGRGTLFPYVFSPDGRSFLAGQPNGADLWDAGTGELIRSFTFEKPWRSR